MKSNKETLIKLIVFFCMIIFFGRLIYSGDILTYVHPRLVPFIKFSIILMIIISIYYTLDIKKTYNKPVRLKNYRIFIIPLILAFFINPTSDIKSVKSDKSNSNITSMINNSNTKKTKDSSVNDSKSKDDSNLINKDYIVINDDNYLNDLQELSSNIDKYNGMHVKINGFVYKDESIGKDFVCARYLMVCCAADMQIVGLLCKDIANKEYEAESWVSVEGILRKNEDKNALDVMYVEVQDVKNIDEPKDKYVYPK